MADIAKLLAGYKRFHNKYLLEQDSIFQHLAVYGQFPKTLLIGCSDARVDPTIILDASPGDIFMIRNVSNLVPPYQPECTGVHGVSAAIEFASEFLNIENIIVMGHAGCAGIKKLVQGNGEDGSFVGKWVQLLEPAKKRVLENPLYKTEIEQLNACEREAVLVSLENLQTFPFIKKRIDEGKLKTYGWYFSIFDGKLYAYNPQTNEFESVLDR